MELGAGGMGHGKRRRETGERRRERMGEGAIGRLETEERRRGESVNERVCDMETGDRRPKDGTGRRVKMLIPI